MDRLDDLQINGLGLYQDPELYCFTSDAVLLANTVRAGTKSRVVDLCSGSGIIGILIASKQGAKAVHLVEIQQKMYDLAVKNIKHNNLGENITAHHCSVQDAPKMLGVERFDVVVCNPPYQSEDTGYINNKQEIAICKTEILLKFSELATSAAKLLKYGGKFWVIHRADRLVEIIYELKKNGLEPKKITFIKPKADKQPDSVIIEASKGGKTGVRLDTITVFKKNNTYTERVKALYGKK